MRIYVVDQLNEDNIRCIEALLRQKKLQSSVNGLFWIQVPDALLSEEQRAHLAECGPYAFGLETHPAALHLELLARAQNQLHCGCIAYADKAQRDFALDWVDTMLRELDIPV